MMMMMMFPALISYLRKQSGRHRCQACQKPDRQGGQLAHATHRLRNWASLTVGLLTPTSRSNSPIYRYHLALLLPGKSNDLCHPGRAPI